DQSGSDLDPVYTDPRVGDVRDSQADITRARELLDYEPTVFLEEGIQRTLAWYRTQRAPA
ncbi:MAG: hypothetical protein QGG89_15125, partial [Vicinamibacterales bacterium]|nr:hypothetical protein [Vicinamibacterales bacterium]